MQQKQRTYFDFPAAILLILIAWITGLRLQVTAWTQNLEKVEMSLIMAVIIGILLGATIFNRKVIIWMGITFTLVVLSWQFSLFWSHELVWAQKQILLVSSVWKSFIAFLTNETVQGTTFFLFLLVIIFWIVGITAGYFLVKKANPWVQIVILFVGILLIDAYSPYVGSRYVYSALFVLFTILLAGRLFYIRSSTRWEDKKAMIDYGIGVDFSKLVITFSLLLVIIAWGIPGLVQLLTPGSREQQKFVEFWDPFQERFSNLVADLQAPKSTQADFFAKRLALGTNISESETVVFEVDYSKKRPGGLRFYWRGYSYDLYEDGEWQNTIEEFQSVTTQDWPLEFPEWEAFGKVDFQYTWNYGQSRILYHSGYPLFVNRNVKIVGDYQNVRYSNYLDRVSIYVDEALDYGDQLQISTFLPAPTANQLREAEAVYPEWVVDYYLQTPDDLSPQIHDLAVLITEGLTNNYDKANAITEYLRKNIQYENLIEEIPENVDPVEWFLFEHRAGFCNYYASSEVLLLRSIGIPARISVGFAQGTAISGRNAYEIQLRNRHSWPEVYFSGYGWIEFEPTVTYPQASYIEEEQFNTQPDPESLDLPEGEIDPGIYDERIFDEFLEEGVYEGLTVLPRFYNPAFEWNVFLLTIGLIGLVVWVQNISFFSKKYKTFPAFVEGALKERGFVLPGFIDILIQRSRLVPVERYYTDVYWMLRLLGIQPAESVTPSELMGLLIDQLPENEKEARILLSEYEKAKYSQYPIEEKSARDSYRQLWVSVVKTFLAKIFLKTAD